MTLVDSPRLRHNAELFATLVERQLRLRSKRAWIAVIWPLLAPLVLLSLYLFVFRSVFKVPIPRYGVFLYAGLLPWSLVAQGLGAAVTALSNEPDLVRRARFPYEFLPMASVASLAVFFVLNLIVFVIFLMVTGPLNLALLPLLVVPTLALVLLVMSLATVLALVDVYNRDLRVVLANLLTAWFFLIPIVYSQGMVSRRMRVLRSIDPMNMIVGQFRSLLYYGHLSRPAHLALMAAVCSALSVACIAGFRRFAPDLPRDV
jgi:lipopolysaccharide transport system permease protein